MTEELAQAIRDGHWPEAERLLNTSPLPSEERANGRSLDAILSSGETLLQIAVEARYPAILRRLLDAGANPNTVNARGDTPLIVSCRGDFAVETGILLDFDADPNYRTPSGWTALRCAAKDRNYAAVRILLARGAAIPAGNESWAAALDDFARAVAEE